MLSRKVMSGGAPTDPYFKNVALLLHGDGTNGGQNNTFIDGSTNNFTITRNGNTTQGSFNPYGTLWSNYFDGSGDYLSLANPNTAIGSISGDFTIEFWVNWSVAPPGNASGNERQLIGQHSWPESASGNWWVLCGVNVGLYFYLAGGGSYDLITSSSFTWSVGRWYHVAAVRSGSTVTLYLDGASVGSGTSTKTLCADNVRPLTIGADNDGSHNPCNAYISNLRLVKGTAVYTANFSPPGSPLTAISNTSLLTCQSNRFIDNSTNNSTITRNGDTRVTSFAPFAPTSVYTTGQGASGYFDGTDDYLSVADNVNLRPGAGAFTIEAWIYRNASGAAHTIFAKGGASTGVVFQVTSGDLLRFTHTTTNIDSTGTVAANAWVHVAVVREGTGTNQTKLYINGTADGQGTVSTDFTQTEEARIGTDRSAASDFNGYISNFRLVKGTAVYTAAFTPPTSPLTAITNTSLLCNFKNAAIFDSAAKNDLETVGNVQIDTTTKKFGTGSLEFDGTGDRLTLPSIPLYRFPGSFTIEFWVNFTSVTPYSAMLVGTTQNTQLFVNTKSNSTGLIMGLTGVAIQAEGSKTWSTGTWYHVALVRDVSNVKFYVDGIDVTDSTYTVTTTYYGEFRIGLNENDTNGFIGFLDDFRITNGVARYTANFTPPALPFSNR